MARKKGLTDKQQRFVEEYMIDLNATQAAIRAGYSPETAAEQGSRLLKNVKVSAAIARAKAERSKRTGITADRVLMELAKVAFVNAKDIIDFDNATVRPDASGEDLSCVAAVRRKIIPTEFGDGEDREVRLYDKLKALDLLCRHLGIGDGKTTAEGEAETGVVEMPAVLEPEKPPEEGAPDA